MAMARIVSQTRVRSTSSIMCMWWSSPRIMLTTTHRHGSNQSGKPQLIEVDLDSSSSSNSNSNSNEDGEVLGIRKLEDVIHNIIVKRSAPDWLPFIPGSSYWVPPPRTRRPQGVVQLLGKLTNPTLSNEESLSLSTFRGWPSSLYFLQETSSTHPVPVDFKVEVTIEKDTEKEPLSEDED